jgi:Fe-S oxidoreductase
VCFNWGLVRGLFPFLSALPYPDEVAPVALFLDVFAILVLAGLVTAAVRRAFFAPPHLHLSLDANLILLWIGTLMLSSLFGGAFRLVAEGAAGSPWTPFASLLAPAFAGLAPATAGSWVSAMWWVHTLGVLGFLAYLPFSKHLHLLASPFNVFFSNLGRLGDLTIAGGIEESAAGSARWEELTWKQLLGGLSCAECGRCDRACPAAAAGFPLLPQQVIQRVKKHMIETGLTAAQPAARPAAAAAAIAGGGAATAVAEAEAPAPAAGGNGNGHARPALIGEVIPEAEIWACTTCMACMERCAVWNEQVPLVVQFRRHLVSEGLVEKNVQDMLANLTRYGNSFGKSDRMRAKWTQPLASKPKDARKEPVEYLWFVGDYASYDPRLEEITRKTAAIFAAAGLDFGLLYEGERNAGNDVRRVGEEGLFEVLREKNLQALGKATFQTVVTTDPHTYNALKNEYRPEGGPLRVQHYTEVLDRLLAEGKLPLKQKLSGRVTYHDPCYLGRYNGVYDAPRRVLAALGLEVVEMPRSRNRSFCCGAGGGRIWMEDVPGIKERPAESRVREAAALPGVTALVVSCPKDIAMFRDAVKTTGTEGALAVRDLAELVWDALQA